MVVDGGVGGYKGTGVGMRGTWEKRKRGSVQ